MQVPDLQVRAADGHITVTMLGTRLIVVFVGLPIPAFRSTVELRADVRKGAGHYPPSRHSPYRPAQASAGLNDLGCETRTYSLLESYRTASIRELPWAGQRSGFLSFSCSC
jgi:hypothetical protein